MRKKLSLSEFAKKIGVSRPAVVKAISSGRIPRELVGETELSTGRRVPVIIDPVRARSAFLDEGGLSLVVPKSPPANRAPATTESPDSDADASDGDDGYPTVSQSRRMFESYRALTARLEYEEKSGKMVDAQEFLAKYSSLIVVARTLLLGVPSKAKGRIPHLTVDDLEILTSLIRDTLDNVADGYPEFDAWFESERPRWLPLIFVSRAPAASDAKAFAHHEDHK
jgi:hypothetical protein